MSHKPVALIVLDGWGYSQDPTNNAVAAAQTPCFDALWKEHPHALLEASGLAVGLPEGQVGNSEIGHTTIGAGTIIDTDLVRIIKAVKDGSFAANPAFQGLFSHVAQYGSTLHVVGLLSPGGVHSHSEHLYAFLRAARAEGVDKLAIHAITDGRDTPPRSAAQYLRELEKVITEVGIGHIATVSGRFYAMDRDQNWHRLAKAEEALYGGDAPIHHKRSASEVVEELYKQEKLDEHLEPIVFLDEEGSRYHIEENDAVFIFNYRPDRSRMLSKRLHERAVQENIMVVTMTEYDATVPIATAFSPRKITTTLAAEISAAGLTQAHIAETEKFPHATYFLNGGKQEPHTGEEHVMLASRKDVDTHDKAPEMRAEAIADAAVQRIEQGVDFLFINFANPDMVGHTGNVPAIITAVETTDRQLCRVVEAIRARDGVLLVTADHGNAELNIDSGTGEVHTAHTLNMVPLIGVGLGASLQDGSLADLAPTSLALLGVPQPGAMTGKNLIV
jgi:2,3-bisphosphoglycerate-independent phosphoglycerate mutase